MRIYVIKLNARWVEVRRSALPIKGILHRVTKSVRYNGYIDQEDTLESIEWKGGKHLTSLKFSSYAKLASQYGLGLPTLRRPYLVPKENHALFKEDT